MPQHFKKEQTIWSKQTQATKVHYRKVCRYSLFVCRTRSVWWPALIPSSSSFSSNSSPESTTARHSRPSWRKSILGSPENPRPYSRSYHFRRTMGARGCGERLTCSEMCFFNNPVSLVNGYKTKADFLPHIAVVRCSRATGVARHNIGTVVEGELRCTCYSKIVGGPRARFVTILPARWEGWRKLENRNVFDATYSLNEHVVPSTAIVENANFCDNNRTAIVITLEVVVNWSVTRADFFLGIFEIYA